jgi:isoleucyl-tRNA synthetase
MISTRPDWCISRQRAWGVPMIALFCESCGEPMASRALCEHVATLFEVEGADAWFTHPVEDLAPPGVRCSACDGTAFRRESDILDVWFDSGVSWAAVVNQRPELGGHADLYLEGSDQHRGWFHSALLTSVAVTGRAPYDEVLTHGFTLDGEGRKMSKTLGNTIAPEDVIREHGAELLRLWVAAEDYRDDVNASKEVLGQQVEAYRRLRNTGRFLLSNLYDFDPVRDRVSHPALPPLECWALHRTAVLATRVREAYEAYEFHTIYHALNNFCSVDMSAIYLDVRKDRLYCERESAPDRRATQTVLYDVLDVLVRLMAPICSFTADEIWRFMPGDDRTPSVFLAGMPEVPTEWLDDAVATRFEHLLGVRAAITKAIEEARTAGGVKRAGEVRVSLMTPNGSREGLDPAELGELALVSGVELVASLDAPESPVLAGARVAVARAEGEKCPRCWIVRPPAGASEHPALCARCLDVVS